MEFFAGQHHTTIYPTISATGTISVNPPGGTGSPHSPHHTDHLPLPTHGFPTPVSKYVHHTHVGQTALWIIFALFTAGLLGVFVLSQRVEKRARLFHWLSALVLTIAMVSYFVMASGLGMTWVPMAYHHHDAGNYRFYRELFYARSIDWLFTTPLLLLSLAFIAGLSPYETLLAVLADIFMIVTGLFSSLVGARWASGERAKWGWFAVSCAGFLYIWYIMFRSGFKAVADKPRKTRGLYVLLSAMTFVLWCAYPVVFALSEGTNKISADAEIIAYGILDVAAKLGFTYMLLMVHTHGDEYSYNLPEWFVENREGPGNDGRGRYGALGDRN